MYISETFDNSKFHNARKAKHCLDTFVHLEDCNSSSIFCYKAKFHNIKNSSSIQTVT